MYKIRDEKGDIIINNIEIQRFIRNYLKNVMLISWTTLNKSVNSWIHVTDHN